MASPLSGYLGHQLRRVFAQFTAQAMGEGGQSRDFVVLDVLADEDAHSQQDLAERLGINRTTMVHLIDRLQEAGHVTRLRNPSNRRSYVLSLTDSGRKALKGMRKTASSRDAQLTVALTAKESKRLNELLGKLIPDPDPTAVRSTEYLVAQAHFRMRRLGDGKLADVGLRMRHFGPLSAIANLGPCPQQLLAQHLTITEPAAAQVVDELVQAGLVARGQDPHDRRRYALELTDLGRQQLTVARKAAKELQADAVKMLGAKEEEELRALLTKLQPA